MSHSQAILDALERNKEMMGALEARRGTAKAYIVRKAAEGLCLGRLAVPPKHAFQEDWQHELAKKFRDEAEGAWLQAVLAGYVPESLDLSDEQAGKLAEEFYDEVTSMSKVIMLVLNVEGEAK